MPHSAVKKVAEFKELVMMSSGVTMEFMKVELRCSQGGVPIFEFGGEGNDTVDNFDKMAVWEDIKSAMGRGHCRIRYLYKRKQWGEKPNPQAA
ncbi:MAG: hypothetical protein M1829_000134 [Trizodia sp. TS-e1964]|nr:MAG: hypothetical protein M1829_000134 [Trizodia sp. TS-e1964]